MLSNLSLSTGIVFPLVLIMTLGYVLKRIGVVDDHFTKKGIDLAFSVGFPCSIVTSLSGVEFSTVFDGKLLVYIIGFNLCIFVLLLLIVPRLIRDRTIAASVIQAIFRNNTLVQTVPLMAGVYGAHGAAEAAFILPFSLISNNILATAVFVILIPDQKDSRGSLILGSVKKLALNPQVDACLFAVILMLLHVTLPPLLGDTVSTVGRMAAPLTLICMGADLKFRQAGKDLKYTVPAVFCKLVVIPLAVVAVGYCLGFRGIRLGALFLLAGTSSSISSFSTAAVMGGNADIASQCMYLSAIASAFTLTLGLAVMLQYGLL